MGKGQNGRRGRRGRRLPKLGVDPGAAAREPELRSATLTIRLTPAERRHVQELADHYGVTITTLLLGLVDQAWEAMRKKGGQT